MVENTNLLNSLLVIKKKSMHYQTLCDVYENLEKNSSRLIKTKILADLLKKLKKEKHREIIYLLQGKVYPDYVEKEFGISEKLCIKALTKASGETGKEIIDQWKKQGDLGEVAEKIMSKKKQNTLFNSTLTTEKVMDNLRKIPELEGKGTVDKKMGIIAELLTTASGKEAKYIIRTLLNQLRIGVASGTIRDAIVEACLEKNKETSEAVQDAYDKTTDFLIVFEKAQKGVKALNQITITPGHPLKVMLALKAESIEDGFKRTGKPTAFEYKYDGFRMMINKLPSGEIKIFTRRLDEVTNQFPDVVKYVKEHVNAQSFIIDCEAVGYDPKTKRYRPFEAVSQRIRRKHNISELVTKLPIEINAFDIIYLNGKTLISEPFKERSKQLRKIVKNKQWHLKTAIQLITDDEKEAKTFYKQALKDSQEGIMIKNLDAEYRPGARVGHMLKLKPAENEFDLVITGAEYGKGKRVGVFSSFTLSCRDENNQLREIGKASTGLKEKSELGLSFMELTKKIKPLIIKEHGRMVTVKPKLVVTIRYQNIQRSPTYASGFALRFPRIIQFRPDRSIHDIATIKEVLHDFERHALKVQY